MAIRTGRVADEMRAFNLGRRDDGAFDCGAGN
jgi:hypothetical protein